MAAFTQVSVHNGGAFVVSCSVVATAEGQPWSAKSGNYGSGSTHHLQVPADATDITVEVRGEKFIDDWKTLYQNEWPDTSTWPADGLTFSTSGTAFDMHCSESVGSGQPA